MAMTRFQKLVDNVFFNGAEQKTIAQQSELECKASDLPVTKSSSADSIPTNYPGISGSLASA